MRRGSTAATCKIRRGLDSDPLQRGLGQLVTQLIAHLTDQGLLFRPDGGQLTFTVPLVGEYLRRNGGAAVGEEAPHRNGGLRRGGTVKILPDDRPLCGDAEVTDRPRLSVVHGALWNPLFDPPQWRRRRVVDVRAVGLPLPDRYPGGEAA